MENTPYNLDLQPAAAVIREKPLIARCCYALAYVIWIGYGLLLVISFAAAANGDSLGGIGVKEMLLIGVAFGSSGILWFALGFALDRLDAVASAAQELAKVRETRPE